jgi:hypothetical protein
MKAKMMSAELEGTPDITVEADSRAESTTLKLNCFEMQLEQP